MDTKADIWVEEAINEALDEKITDENIDLFQAERYAETGLSLSDIQEKLNIPLTPPIKRSCQGRKAKRDYQSHPGTLYECLERRHRCNNLLFTEC